MGLMRYVVPVTPPLVSVIIPTYGRPRFLLDAIESVSSQDYRPVELVVVDDCSPEPVQLGPTHGLDVRVIRHARNMGPGAARNSGVAHAKGEYVLFLDDDDLLQPGRLSLGVSGIGNAQMHATESDPPGRRRFEGDMRATLLYGPLPQMGQVLLRRADVLQFDPTLRVSEDVEWWIRMRDRAVFNWSSDIGVLIRQHPTPRPGVDADVRAACRAAVVQRHIPVLDRRSRAYQLNRAASGALQAGRRVQTVRYVLRSLVAMPSMLAIKLLGRSVLPDPLAASE